MIFNFQARTHQLLIHNKELLDHLQTLVRHIQELEAVTNCKERGAGSTQQNSVAATATGMTLPQVCRVEILGVNLISCNSVVVCVFLCFSA